METPEKIFNAIEIVAIVALFTYVGIEGKEPTHYCESREIKAYCYDFSFTLKTCYTLPAKQGGKRCTEGWNEIPFIESDIPTVEPYNSGNEWKCPKRPNPCIKQNIRGDING